MAYVYLKKPPRYRMFKGRSSFSLFLSHIEKKKGVGFFLILIGTTLLLSTFIIRLPLFDRPTEAVVNPVPPSDLLANIQTANQHIDAAHPLAQVGAEVSKGGYDTSYSTPFYIDFPSLHLKHIKVTPNIDSADAQTDEKILSGSTAHFKGTALPGEAGNIFIYGHSSVTWFHQLYPYSYEGVFTALFDLNIGDSITIEFNNTTYTYVVEGIQTIDPTDFSLLQNTEGTNTLTLMTCSPPGIGDKRLIIKALQIS